MSCTFGTGHELAGRIPRIETRADHDKGHDYDDIAALLADGCLTQPLWLASQHRDPSLRQRFKQLQALLAGPPLHRRLFDVTYDPATDVIELRSSPRRRGD